MIIGCTFQPGLIDKFGLDCRETISNVARVCEESGQLEDAIRLYHLAEVFTDFHFNYPNYYLATVPVKNEFLYFDSQKSKVEMLLVLLIPSTMALIDFSLILYLCHPVKFSELWRCRKTFEWTVEFISEPTSTAQLQL